MTHFIALLRRSGSKSAVSERYAYIGLRSFRICWNVVNRKTKLQILVYLPEEPPGDRLCTGNNSIFQSEYSFVRFSSQESGRSQQAM